jgi:alpha-L-fucosidase
MGGIAKGRSRPDYKIEEKSVFMENCKAEMVNKSRSCIGHNLNPLIAAATALAKDLKGDFPRQIAHANRWLSLIGRTVSRLALSVTVFFVNALAAKAGYAQVIVHTNAEPVIAGKFEPTWESLKQYHCPQWFRDAKFGIWAHWGAQCEPEDGDWYARGMYQTGSWQYQFHTNHYGSPAEFGFKEVIHKWHAENWDPEKLIKLYKRAGAQYFFALANHHDNFDNWDSQYQPWNSMKVGPRKDLIGGWAKAARESGLRFGVSVHAAHAWTWYEPSQNYDGNLTRVEGKGIWWEGFDPQDLYAQKHPHSRDWNNPDAIHSQWDWGNGASLPDQAYCDKFYNRTADLIRKYHPDLIYFDDTALPLWPMSDAGLKIAADFYNTNIKLHGLDDDGVLFGKILTPEQQQCMVWDIERGQANEIEPYPWQTDTCIGAWHYDRALYQRNGYKSAQTVIQMLCDIVSKNGNLLLNIPVRGDGTIDEKELKVVEGIADWMAVNKECIFGTRPWIVFGEGPASAGAKLTAQGFNEGKGKPFTAQDVRFTQSTDGKTIYAIVLGAPTNAVSIHAFGHPAWLLDRSIKTIRLLGSREKIHWQQTDDALQIAQPGKMPNAFANVFKITLFGK